MHDRSYGVTDHRKRCSAPGSLYAIPVPFVTAISIRMQEDELWVGDMVRNDHWNDDRGRNCFDVDFRMDTLVAHGSWAREMDEHGKYEYVQIGPEPEDLELSH